MPKKPPPNGYYYFMRYYKAREEKLGRRFPNGMKDVSVLASEEWKSLPQQEKEYYNNEAKLHRNDPRPNILKPLEKKFNSAGVSFAQIEEEKVQKEQKLNNQKNYINRLVTSFTIDELRDYSFYLIHVNYFCKTDQGEFYPAELAISEFSLSYGLHNFFHTFLHPGQIPTGYASEVKEFSEKYHKIPLELPQQIDKNELFTDLSTFIKESFEGYKPVFTMWDNLFDNTSMSAVVSVIKNLFEHVYQYGDWEEEFRVLPLPLLLFELKKKCIEDTNSDVLPFPNDTLAETELRKDLYDYKIQMACNFHQKVDVIARCSRSYVIRWAQIIRDHCCHYLGIEALVPSSYMGIEKNSTLEEVQTYKEEEDFDDTKSTKSGFSTATCYTEKSIDFRSVSGKSSRATSVKAAAMSPNPTLSWASAVGSSSKTSVKSWATASQPQQVPSMDNTNFPSLGGGRGQSLAKRMANMSLKK